MSSKKIANYCSKQLDSILLDTTAARAFDLGYAQGMFLLYEHIAKFDDIEYADKIFNVITENNDIRHCKIFNDLVKMYKEENTKAEDILDKIAENKQREQAII